LGQIRRPAPRSAMVMIQAKHTSTRTEGSSFRQQPTEAYRAFVPAFQQVNFLGAGKLFVTVQAFDGVP
jgi:hypothetical protein